MEITHHIIRFMRDYNYFELNQPPPPSIKCIIAHKDKITFHINDIKRKKFPNGDIKPIIDEFRIDWKQPAISKWNTICTKAKYINFISFYLKTPSYKDKQSYYDEKLKHWHEYAFFRKKDDTFDIRIYAVNQSEHRIQPYTHTRLKLIHTDNIKYINDFKNNPPIDTHNNDNNIFIIGNKPNGAWTNYPNHIAIKNNNYWIFIKPDINTIINNYAYNGQYWEDISLKTTILTLINKNQPYDIILIILKFSHLHRSFGNDYSEKYKNLSLKIKEIYSNIKKSY